MKFSHVFLGLLALSLPSVAADNFDWLRDDSRQDERVLSYLKKQNQKTEQFQKSYNEITQHLLSQWEAMGAEKGDKPWVIKNGQEWNLTRRQGNFVLLSRADKNAQEDVVYDFSSRQEERQYFQIGQWRIQGNSLLFTEDIDGSEQYRALLVELNNGRVHELISNVDNGVLLSPNGKFAFVVSKEAKTQRPYQIVRINTQTDEQKVLWQEGKTDWIMSFYPAADARFALVQSNNESTTEQKILNLDSGDLTASLRKPESGVEYYADVAQDRVFINSNLNGQFGLFETAMPEKHADTVESNWKSFLRSENGVEQFYLYEAGLVALTKQDNQTTISVYSYDGTAKKMLPLESDGRVAWLSTLGDYRSNKIRIRSMSMTTPPLWEEFDVKAQIKTNLSQDVYHGFSSQDYVSQRIMVKSQGVEVPVSLAYRKDKLSDNAPVVLYGYGAYGFTMKPYFMPQTVSLLDQGVIYAIAHVRGGGYFGADWHEQGRGVLKANSINDFTAAAQALKHFDGGERDVYAIGSSAGGTLVAGSINQAPDLFAGAVMKVPFVDVVASMSDTTLPLTAQQYGEWGNPTLPEQLKAMQAYDPILNIHKDAYPPMLVQVGLNDQRVPYWEGAKYLAQISSTSESTGPYLLQTDFHSGHRMDPRQAREQQAKEYAFLLSLIKTSKAEQ
ncbi:prolyl oligopeptidase family serine peptidase [Vibrio campbellii]|uniref:prolyl oligopeptidase family serine peptidase n=1 Tax=Vibrio campbellii TaxID=680 RepID=UPI0002ADEBBF|nr:prolyl oligopeptidase family serine peptidase [Vibrio campbellii]ARV74925.1 peptidase S9 [Vibrio campbellii CAIM 519 = NBRC 15631 = ATCC 25920]ELU50099.1 protease II [Vibrio campbellii CAIM 519 = NBRC 15631 = ATCC 25920]